METFEDLEAWKVARTLRMTISDLIKRFPEGEKYRLKDQLLRPSRSVTANIAEGFGRFHHQENVQYCRQARGSLSETLDHLICACDEGLISKSELESIRSQIKQCWKILNGYIAYLKKAVIRDK